MKKEHAYQDLQRQILTLQLAPGDGLDEVNLAEKYAISRTPLREIFQRLAGEGYIEIISNRGAMVSSMDYKTIRNFFRTAPMIYVTIARLATANTSREQLSELQNTQDKFRESVCRQDKEAMVLSNERFHRLIGVIANNPYLQPSYERLLIDHARISQTVFKLSSDAMIHYFEEAVDQHEAMIEYIAINDCERMVAITQEHWELSRVRMARYMTPEPLPYDPAPFNA